MGRLEVLLFLLAARTGPEDAPIDWFEQLDALATGDAAALARLRRLVTVQLIQLGAYRQRDSWDDFAQEVVVKVWRAHRDGKIREQAALPAFVRTTTRNAFVDWARSTRREVDLPDEAIGTQRDASEQPPPLDPGVQLALRNALSQLEARHREVIEAIYLKGLSYDETAEALGRPRGTVNRLQREGISALRGILLPEDGT